MRTKTGRAAQAVLLKNFKLLEKNKNERGN
jgi:hypothetical protein